MHSDPERAKRPYPDPSATVRCRITKAVTSRATGPDPRAEEAPADKPTESRCPVQREPHNREGEEVCPAFAVPRPRSCRREITARRRPAIEQPRNAFPLAH